MRPTDQAEPYQMHLFTQQIEWRSMATILAVVLIALFSLFTAQSANAGETEVRAGVESLTKKQVAITSVRKSGAGDLSEVTLANGDILYATSDGKYVFSGVLIDTRSRENLTQNAKDAAAKISWNDLPLGDAVKVVYGNGKYVMATFEDANCGYCKKLHNDSLQGMDATVYVFPVAVLGNQGRTTAIAVHCETDSGKAWADVMTGKSTPTTECSDGIRKFDSGTALMKKLNIVGTPAIYFKDGTRSAGWLPKEGLTARLEKADVVVSAKK